MIKSENASGLYAKAKTHAKQRLQFIIIQSLDKSAKHYKYFIITNQVTDSSKANC